MRILRTLILVVLVFFFKQFFGQDFNDCKVDFFLLESQESFDISDNGRGYLLVLNNVPNYEIINKPQQTLEEIQNELDEKLKDNADYNKNNPAVRDSLYKYYSELEHNIGLNIIWWEKLREATEDESKEYKKRLKAHNKNVTRRYSIHPDEKKGYGQIWDPSVQKPELIDENTLITDDIIYQLKQKRIRDDLPIFWIQPKDSSNISKYDEDNRKCIIPVGAMPVFNFKHFEKSNFVLRNEMLGRYPINWKQLEFIVDDQYKLTMYNYKFYQGQYTPNKDFSIDIFYDKKKLNKINEFLYSLKSKDIVIHADGLEFINPNIIDISFNLQSLNIVFISEGKSYTKEFRGYPDPNYRYDSGLPDGGARQIYNLPIYHSECYNENLEDFSNLTLRSDYINDPTLKKQLYDAVSSSTDWLNYSVEKIILTSRSQWSILVNKYTGLKESRFIHADVYVKSSITGKCYMQKDVYITQKLDPIGKYVYYYFVSVPQTLEPYPCNLK